MKVISLLQPWAYLFVTGAKMIETRSWNTTYRGPLLVHASLGKYYGTGRDKVSCRELCYKGLFNEFVGARLYDDLPFGAIVGMVNLVETFQFGGDRSIEYLNALPRERAQQEMAFGDWNEGRWGWRIDRFHHFEKPTQAKGSLNLWDFDETTLINFFELAEAGMLSTNSKPE